MGSAGGFLEHVTAGEPLRIGAPTWNAMIDAAKSNREERRSGPPGIRLFRDFATQVVRVKVLGLYFPDGLPRFSVIGLGQRYITDETWELIPTAFAELPGGDDTALPPDFDTGPTQQKLDRHVLAVLLEPIGPDECGWAAISGVVKVWVNGSAGGSRGSFVGPKVGETRYMAGPSEAKPRFRMLAETVFDSTTGYYSTYILLDDVRQNYQDLGVVTREGKVTSFEFAGSTDVDDIALFDGDPLYLSTGGARSTQIDNPATEEIFAAGTTFGVLSKARSGTADDTKSKFAFTEDVFGKTEDVLFKNDSGVTKKMTFQYGRYMGVSDP